MKINLRKSINHWIKTNPDSVGLLLGSVSLVLFQAYIITECQQYNIPIYGDVVAQIYQTMIQIIAALYGLTLTGYIFFSDRLLSSDSANTIDGVDDVSDIIRLLQTRYYRMIIVISIWSICSFIIVESMVLYGVDRIAEQQSPLIQHILVFEVFVSLFYNIALIFYFVINVVDPDKFKRISRKYKAKLESQNGEYCSAIEFIEPFEKINILITENMSTLMKSSEGKKSRISLKMIKSMYRQKILDSALYNKIVILVTYSQYLSFSDDFTASKELCDLANEVLAELEFRLRRQNIKLIEQKDFQP